MAVKRLESYSNRVLEEAQRLYQEGYDVHWIEPPVIENNKTGKKPVGDWKRKKRYTWTQLERSYHPPFGLGFKPGKTSVVRGKQIVVLDVDFGRTPQFANEALRELFGGEVPEPTVITGGGGAHFYLSVDVGEEVGSRVLWKGADAHAEIRVIGSAGDSSGNAVMPPSMHWSGGAHRWGKGGGIVPMPLRVLEELRGEGDLQLDTDFQLGRVIPLNKMGRALAAVIKAGVPRGERNEKLYWVIGELDKKGHSREDILATLLCEEFGISEKYLEAGKRSVTRAQTDIARVLAKQDRAREEEKDRLEGMLRDFNDRYCHIILGDGTRVCYRENGEIRYLREGAFTSIYAHQKYVNASGIVIEPAKIWLVHPDTPVYHGVQFDPEGEPYREGDGDLLNLWQGLATRPGVGKFDLFLEHVRENICAGDEGNFRWLWNWMAHLMQRPGEKPHTAVVLRGGTGTGKSEFAMVLRELVGAVHTIFISESDHLTGKFNRALGDKILVVAEEISWGGNPRENAKLRDMVTRETLQLEPKGVDAFTVRACHRYIFTSNGDWPMQALARERRFAFLQVGEGRQRDGEWFVSMKEELRRGGYGGLMAALLGSGIDEELLFNPPVTDLLREQQERSLGGIDRWINSCLMRGYFVDGGWKVQVDPDRLLRVYKGAYPGDRHSTREDIGRRLTALFYPGLHTTGGWAPPSRRTSGSSSRNYVWRLPNLGRCRELFDKAMGSRSNWGEEEGED